MVVSFVLSMGVAVAAPVLKPQALTLICTAAGSVKLVAGADSPADNSDTGLPAGMQAHALDCVLCLRPGASGSATAVAGACGDRYRAAGRGSGSPTAHREAETAKAHRG